MKRLLGFSAALVFLSFIIGCDSEMKKVKAFEAQGNWTQAQEVLQKAIDKKKDNSQLHNELAFVYMKRGYFDLAFTEVSLAISLDPYSTEAYYNRGSLYYKRTEYANAKIDFEKVIELDKNNPNAYNNLGLIYQFLNNNDEALKNYKRAVEINPADPTFHLNLSILYYNMGNIKLSKEEEDRAKLLKGQKK